MKITVQNKRSIWTFFFCRQTGKATCRVSLGEGSPEGRWLRLSPMPRAQCVQVKGSSRGTANVYRPDSGSKLAFAKHRLQYVGHKRDTFPNLYAITKALFHKNKYRGIQLFSCCDLFLNPSLKHEDILNRSVHQQKNIFQVFLGGNR